MPNEKTPDRYWELREPAFPHYTWRVFFSGRLEVWDGQLVSHREATDQERAAMMWSLGLYLAQVDANG